MGSRQGFDDLVKPNNKSTDDDDGGDLSDLSSDPEFSDDQDDAENSDEAEDMVAQQVADLVYSNERDEMDINYDLYQFSVAQKFDFSTRNLTYKKYKYIADELFLDLSWRLRHTLAFKATLVTIVILFWLRIFVHYTFQYLVCAMLGVPVTSYEPKWHRVQLVYAAWEFWQDAFIVSFGALGNTIIFMIWVFIA